jgi:hypothetical protein
MRNTCNILLRRPEEKRPFARPMLRWKDNIRINLKGTGCEGVDWIHLAQDRSQWRALVNTVMVVQVT